MLAARFSLKVQNGSPENQPGLRHTTRDLGKTRVGEEKQTADSFAFFEDIHQPSN